MNNNFRKCTFNRELIHVPHFVSKILVKILIGKHPTEMIDLHLLIVGCRFIARIVQIINIITKLPASGFKVHVKSFQTSKLTL